MIPINWDPLSILELDGINLVSFIDFICGFI